MAGAFRNGMLFRIANFSGKPIKLALYISGYKSEDIWATITIHGTRVRQCSLVLLQFFA